MNLKAQLKHIGMLTTFASFMLVSSVSHAAIINYDEASNGDLAETFGSATTFDLAMAGDHQWSGSAFVSDAPFTEDIDAFLITVAPGFEIFAVTSSISNLSFGGALFGNVDVESFIRINRNSPLFRVETDLLTQQASLEVNALPIGEGQYQVWAPSQRRFSCFDSNGCSANWDWTFTIQTRVTSVTEPGTIALMAASLLGMAIRRRRSLRSA